MYEYLPPCSHNKINNLARNSNQKYRDIRLFDLQGSRNQASLSARYSIPATMISMQSAKMMGADAGSDTASMGDFVRPAPSVDASFGSDAESDESVSSHLDDSAHMGNGRDGGGDSSSGAGLKIAQREHQAVMIWKMVVMSAMILITIGVSIAVFVYVDSKEQEAFESNFQDDTFKIFSELGGGIVQRFSHLDHMAIDMVSYANTSGSEWPYVTLPNYALRASKSRRSTGAVAMENFYYIQETNTSLVADKGRHEWQSYTRDNGEAWTQRTLELQEIDDSYMGDQASPEGTIEVEHSGIWYGSTNVPSNSGP